MWSLHGSGERKFVRGIWATWPRWTPRPYMVKTLQRKFCLRNQRANDLGPWYVALGPWGPSKFVQIMTLSWPWPILWQSQINLVPYAFICENLLESHLMEETYSKWPVTWGICLYKNSDPRGLSTPALGLYTYIKKNMKILYKIRVQDIFLKLVTNGQSDKALLLTSGFCPQRVACPCPRAIYMWKNILKCV